MTQSKPVKMQEVVVVEGIHDAQAVRRAVEADVWVIGGDRVANRFLNELKRAAAVRGVIVLTDPDGPGERIRERIRRAVPTARHAFIPKHQASGRREGKNKIGVEHARLDVIREVLENARGAEESVSEKLISEASVSVRPLFTVQDLTEAGLIGGSSAASRREHVGDILGIGSGNGKSFLRKLNALRVTREEWDRALNHLKQTEESS
ncbi:toprim domain-containing protein [Alicyclobacillus sp. SO9]|uniref:toprim domain-containing protein n=1 Tax=Alicyclobacillus sp. SO9 TaxID=2665646 RepID=UPI0018E71AFA|nr:DUF4093 domain-containing protein [Alicyclobacillus sp. SO9]QQE79391.1 DUF4093 domain-containing protein [Alicyclobacillus sp. SO9]